MCAGYARWIKLHRDKSCILLIRRQCDSDKHDRESQGKKKKKIAVRPTVYSWKMSCYVCVFDKTMQCSDERFMIASPTCNVRLDWRLQVLAQCTCTCDPIATFGSTISLASRADCWI